MQFTAGEEKWIVIEHMSRIIDRQRFKRTYPFFKSRPQDSALDGSDSASMAAIDATYIVINNTSDLPNERAIIAGSGMNGSDGGAGGNFTLSVDPNLVAFVSGATFVQLSGSLQKTGEGISYLVAGSNVSITSQSNGQIFISATGGGSSSGGGAYLNAFGTGSITPNSATWADWSTIGTFALTGSSDGISLVGGDTITFVSGGIFYYSAKINTFSGGAYFGLRVIETTSHSSVLERTHYVAGGLPSDVTGLIVATAGQSYKLQYVGTISTWSTNTTFDTEPSKTSDLTVFALGSSSSSSGGSGAPVGAQYLTLANDSTLTSERVLTAGGGVTLTDGGANGAATLGINNNVVATISGSTFTKLSGSLQRTSAGLSYIVGQGAVSIVSSSAGQIFVSSSMGAPIEPQFLTLATDPTLPNERVFTPGTGLLGTDGGAGSTFTVGINDAIVATISGSTFTKLSGSLQQTAAGLSYLVGQGATSVVSSSAGQIFLSSSAGAPVEPRYLTLAVDPTLPNERVFTAGTGLLGTDGGAGSSFTTSIDNNVVATISGSRFTGNVVAAAGLSGSLQQLSNGTSYLIGLGSVTVTSASNGQIFISGSGTGGASSGAPADAQYLTLVSNGTLSDERVFTPSTGLLGADGGAGSTYTIGIDDRVVATISGSAFTRLSGSLQKTSAGLSYLVGSNAITVNSGTAGATTAQIVLNVDDDFVAMVSGSTFFQLSGSLQKTSGGLSYLVAGAGINIVSGTASSAGQVIISSTDGSDNAASYVVLSTTSSLPNERALTAGGGVTITDGGAGSTITLGINNGTIATISGSTFTQLSGSLQRTAAGVSYLVAVGGIDITTGSNGQIFISGSSNTAAGSSIPGADREATFVLMGVTASLPNERALTAGTGLLLVDGGAGSTATFNVNNNFVAFTSGTIFTQLSGSLQRTSNGLSYLVNGGGVTVNSGTAGAATSQVIFGTDNNIVATISGSTFTQLSGSLQKTSGGLSYLVAGAGINIVSGTASSAGQVIITSNAPSDNNASYVVLGVTSSLANERALTAGGGVTITDAGAGSTITLGINDNLIATVSGTIFTKLSGSLQSIGTGASYLVAGANVTITSATNGQIFISSQQAAGSGLTYVTGSWFENALNQYVTTGSVSVDSQKRSASTIGTDIIFWVSGSQSIPQNGVGRKVAVFGGDTWFSGTAVFASGSGGTADGNQIGTDAFFYVSGTQGVLTGINRKIAVFAGDVVVSGSTLFASGGKTAASAVQVGTDAFFFVSGSQFVASGPNRKVAVFGGDIQVSGSSVFASGTVRGSTIPVGTDAFFFVSGTSGVASGVNRKVAVFAGDLVVSGSTLFASGGKTAASTVQVGTDAFFFVSGTSGVATGANRKVSVFGGDVQVSGSVVFASGTSRGSSIPVGTDAIFFVSGSQGVATGVNRKVAVFAGDIVVSGSSVFANTGTAQGLINVGTDAFFFVSGSQFVNSLNTNRKVTVLGGDVVISSSIAFPTVGTGAVATTGSLRFGYPGGVITPVMTSVNSDGTTVSIISTSGNAHQFGNLSQNIYQASNHNWYDSAGTPHAYLDGTDWRTNTSFSVDTNNRIAGIASGLDTFFFVSGSANVPMAAVNDPTIRNPNRHVAVFGGDIHCSGSTRFTHIAGTSEQTFIKVDDQGQDLNLLSFNGDSALAQWGNNGLFHNFLSYGLSLFGNNAGVNAYDGRNVITTDLACVSQYLISAAATTANTLQPTNLTFLVNAGEKWFIEFKGGVSRTTSAAGVAFGVDAPATSTIEGQVFGATTNFVTFAMAEITAITTATGAVATVASSIPRMVTLYATVIVGAAGSITIQFASVGAVSGTSTIAAGAMLTARRVTGV